MALQQTGRKPTLCQNPHDDEENTMRALYPDKAEPSVKYGAFTKVDPAAMNTSTGAISFLLQDAHITADRGNRLPFMFIRIGRDRNQKRHRLAASAAQLPQSLPADRPHSCA